MNSRHRIDPGDLSYYRTLPPRDAEKVRRLWLRRGYTLAQALDALDSGYIDLHLRDGYYYPDRVVTHTVAHVLWCIWLVVVIMLAGIVI